MARHKITKIVVTTEGGVEHTFDGNGSASLVVTKTEGQPTARLEVTMPLAAEWRSGTDGRYIAVPGSSLSS